MKPLARNVFSNIVFVPTESFNILININDNYVTF